MEKFAFLLVQLLLMMIVPVSAIAQPQQSLRPYILKAVDMLNRDRRPGGYDMNKRFTQDLHYGSYCCVKASRPLKPKPPYPTMCVAAVVETMIEALNLYGKSTGDTSFVEKFPPSRLDGDTRTALIPNVFRYSESDSPGTGYALDLLGLGRELPFEQLQPGDFITFSRSTGSGHAVVFIGFLTSSPGIPVDRFSGQVVGFKYFSAQGMGRPDGGFGYRNAYFAGKCPNPRGKDDDCNIIGLMIKPDGSVVQSRSLFNSGEMFAPPSWDVEGALTRQRTRISRGFEDQGLTRGFGLEEAIQFQLTRKLKPDPSMFEDGTQQ
jgi:hypothetical protein